MHYVVTPMASPGQKFTVGVMLIVLNAIFFGAMLYSVLVNTGSNFAPYLRWLPVFSLILSAGVILQISRL